MGQRLVMVGNFVELRTLDSYKLQNISLLKIDVEGAELGVLHGAISTIKNPKPVIMIELREDTKEQAYKILGSLGYELQQIIGELQDHNYIAIPKLSSPKQ